VSTPDIDSESVTILLDEQTVRWFDPPAHSLRGSETLLLAHVAVAPFEDPSGSALLSEKANEKFLAALDAERQALQDEKVGIAIHDEPWNPVALGEDETIGIGHALELEQCARSDSTIDPSVPEGFVDCLFSIPSQQTHDDLGTPIQVTTRQPLALATVDLDDIAIVRLSIDARHRAGKDPGMMTAYRLVVARSEKQLRHRHDRILFRSEATE
jgi:hypothetical protein